MSFKDLGLSAELLRAIDSQGYQSPTPIQMQAIPAILDGRDVLACAQTGTGKTAGFTLPILQGLQNGERKPGKVQALIIVPTRELAAQVDANVRAYGAHLPFRSLKIYGGISMKPQVEKLRAGIDIVVATPGRLLDHAQSGTIDLSELDVLVLDEADRMLDMGFIRDIKRILRFLPDDRQNLLFSATFSKDIRKLAAGLLNRAVEIDVAPKHATADRVKQIVHPVDKQRKRELLSELIGKGNWSQVLVFTRTKHGANRLSKQLQDDGLSTATIHGNKSQNARTKALDDFKGGRARVLVATDVAARGIDIKRLPHVVNYELPHVAEDYVHRIGRTARAGEDGHALSLVCVDELPLLKGIERLLKTRIPKVNVDGYDVDPTIRAEPLSTGGRNSRGRGSSKPGSNARRRKRRR